MPEGCVLAGCSNITDIKKMALLCIDFLFSMTYVQKGNEGEENGLNS